MNALGMLEVYGKVPAVVALDSALKAANVTCEGVTRTGGGLVTICISGDVGATKAAIDAACSAVEAMGEIIAVHVIPRPAENVRQVLEEDSPTEEKSNTMLPEALPEALTEDIEAEVLTEAALKQMTVVMLRNTARKLKITTMPRKHIKYANKRELVNAICDYFERE